MEVRLAIVSPRINRELTRNFVFIPHTGEYEMGRPITGVDTHFRQNGSYGVAGWRNG
ncbi:MAG: hypothetical protein P8O23_11045 [Opitutales bacterium]|nr:hypothetical protein [Opitutales bacterium]